MGLFDIFKKNNVKAPQSEPAVADFEMVVRDVFYVAQRGVVLDGIIKNGAIKRGDEAKKKYEFYRGQDLVAKGLKYVGYTTPSCVRLIGICPDCGKSFAFHGYSFYMTQNDVAYSDDGLDCCSISDYDIDKDNWSFEADGKTFRYYNSFNCPHCGIPYIDYKNHPENKVFGVSGCVHLGRKAYQTK